MQFKKRPRIFRLLYNSVTTPNVKCQLHMKLGPVARIPSTCLPRSVDIVNFRASYNILLFSRRLLATEMPKLK